MLPAWVQQHKTQLLNTLFILVIFAAGWQVGRVMSPYYASHEIIFTDSPLGSPQNLEELITPPDKACPPDWRGAGGLGESVVAGQQSGQYVASVNSNLYHEKSCSAAKRINPENQVWFATHQDAQAAGFSPSKCTLAQ